MAEQTFRSPGFFEREIDLSQRESEVVGVPAGVVGTAQMGPAFVPVTVGSFADFERKFGSLDPKKFGPYAVREFLKHRTAVTYVRVLGAGSNETATDIANTRAAGIVKSAGFKIIGTKANTTVATVTDNRHQGAVQFIAARHWVSASGEPIGFPVFSDNDSFNVPSGDGTINLVRGMLFTSTGSRFQILCMNSASWGPFPSVQADLATVDSLGQFKLVLSSTAGSAFASDDGFPGIRIYTASLNPVSDNYISKILNTDPERFQVDQHLLYAHFPVETEVAVVSNVPGGTMIQSGSVALMSGSALSSEGSGISSLPFIDAYGRFDTRYAAPKTTSFISQPYGNTEFDLFHFECISDGTVANESYKISISNVKKSSNPTDPYGTFTVEVRAFGDTDTSPKILEQYSLCTLNPNDSNYIAKKIGDFKAYYNFDAESADERKVLVKGKYPNISSRVRVVMALALEEGEVPKDSLPFGFRGFPALKTSDTLTDRSTVSIRGGAGGLTSRRLTFVSGNFYGATGIGVQSQNLAGSLTGSILPPVPFRFKVTRGAVGTTALPYIGNPGGNERVDARYYWGAKFTRIPREADLPDPIFNPNVSSEINDLFKGYARFLGIYGLDNLVTGSGADAFNNNKFTMARVALSNAFITDLSTTATSVITGSAKEHILETAYIRNGIVNPSNYTVRDNIANRDRMTFASLAAITSSVYFNRFSNFTKFTNFMYGGFDGVNILNANMAKMDDKASSSDLGGYAVGGTLDIGLSSENDFGTGPANSTVASYRAAASILTDPMASRVNILVIPGIRDSALTDFVQNRLSSYSKGFYVMDLPSYDANQNRLFDGTSVAPSVEKTAEALDGRALDSNYSATYFPDVTINDEFNNRLVRVPSSVAVMGALAYNDSIAYPWFAPAGFNRAALDFVTNVSVRLNQGDRNTLYEARINPIATFPNAGFVIFGQKTLQLAVSALDRVNVRRMLLEVKRLVVNIANKMVFEQNTPETRARFVSQVTPLLAIIQSQQGIDQFKVVMDSSNNTQADIENNILNGRIVVVPTRAVEFIAIDFIITNAGVSFE